MSVRVLARVMPVDLACVFATVMKRLTMMMESPIFYSLQNAVLSLVLVL